jgi:hypothetical protein
MQEYLVPKGIVDLSVVNQNLLEMLIKVKNSPASIEQANCMCEIANRICDMAKVQVQQANMIIQLNQVKNNHFLE